MKTKKTLTVYKLQREEYKKTFHWVNDENCIETLTYTGKRPCFFGTNKNELLKLNSIPEWKSKIISEHKAEPGHTNKGPHVYDFKRQPYTLLT
jgi:hypothetical protein